MKKFLLTLVAAVFACCLPAWAGTATFDLTQTKGLTGVPTSNAEGPATWSLGGQQFESSYAYNSNYSYLMVGANGYLKLPSFNEPVNSITVKFNSGSVSTAATIGLYQGSSTGTQIGNTISQSSGGSAEFTVNNSVANTAYYLVNNSSKNLQLVSITVVYGEDSGTTEPDPGPTPGATESITFDATAQGYANSDPVESASVPPIDFTFSKGSNTSNGPTYYSTGDALRCYYGNTITVSSTNGAKIVKIEFGFGTGDNGNSLSANNGAFTSPTWTGSETSVVFTIGPNSSGENKGNRRIKTITVTYEGDNTKTPVTLSYDVASVNVAPNGSFTAPTLTITPQEAASAVQYSSSNTAVATIGASGDVSITNALGATTITASISDNDDYTNATASYTLNVVKDGVYTVAEALQAIANGYEGTQKVSGYIISITEVSTSYGNATYIIADDADAQVEDGLTVFRGKYLNGENFTSEDQLQVGALVTVEGNLVNYNGTTPEVGTNNTLISYEAPVVEPELLTVSPENRTEVTEIEDFVVTLTYNVPVSVLAQGRGLTFPAANTESAEYAKVWTVTFPKDYIQGLIYDWNPEEADGIVLALNVNIYATPENATDEDEPLETSLQYPINYSGTYGAPFTLDLNTTVEVNGKFNSFNVSTSEFDYIVGNDITAITITKDETIVAKGSTFADGVVSITPAIYESGTYTLDIPFGTFSVGNNATNQGDEALTRAEDTDELYRTEAKNLEFTLTVNDPEDPSEGANQLPIDEPFTPVTKTDYVFTPETDGVLTMTKEDGDPLYYAWLPTGGLLKSNGEYVEPSYNNGDPDTFAPTTELRWDLTANTTYVFNYDVDKNPEEVGNFTFTFAGEAPENVLKLNFIGDGIDLGANINEYVTVTDLYSTENQGILDINENPYSYIVKEQEGMGYVLGLYITPAEGYSINVTLENAEDVEIDAYPGEEDGTEKNWTIVGGEIGTGIVANITISEAADEPAGNAIVLGQTYTVNYQSPVYYYTAKEDGILSAECSAYNSDLVWGAQQLFMWTSEDHINTAQASKIDDGKSGYLVEFAMTAGETLYLWVDSTNDYSFEFSFAAGTVEKGAAIESVEPTTANVFDYNTYFDVIIRGNGGVTNYGDVTFSYNEEVINLNELGDPELNEIYVTTNGYPEFLQVNVAKTGLTNLVAQAALAGANEFTITVNDLEIDNAPVTLNNATNDNVTVDNGTVTVTYSINKAPVYLAEESTWPTTFYNYWPEGDASGIATLVFDEEIESVESVQVAMYPVSPGVDSGETSFTTYSITPVINGTEVTLDFTGHNYVGSTSMVTVIVKNAKGTNGMPVSFGENGVALYQQINFVNQPAVVEPQGAEAYLGISTGDEAPVLNEDYPLTADEEGNYMINYTISAGTNFNIWVRNDMAPANAKRRVNAEDYTVYGPTSNTTLTFTSTGEEVDINAVKGTANYWTVSNEENLKLNISFNPETGTGTVTNNTYIVPEGMKGYVKADDKEYSIVLEDLEDTDFPYTETLTIPVKLVMNDATQLEYRGFQFKVNIPDGFYLANVTLNPVEGFGGTLSWRRENGGFILVYGCNGSTNNPDIKYLVELTVTKTYTTAPEVGTNVYDVTIENVIFTSLDTEDIEVIDGAPSTITEVITNKVIPATAIEITGATLALPSWNRRAGYLDADGMVQYVTEGQSINLTYEITPPNATTKEIEWTTDNDNVTVTGGDPGTATITTIGNKFSTEGTVIVTATVKNVDGVTAEYSFDVKPILAGDANDNGFITVSDVNDIANYVADQESSNANVFDAPNADIDENGIIDAADITAAVNIVLGGSPVPTSMRQKAPAITNDMLSADNFRINSVEPFAIGVELENTNRYVALQAVLTIPSGMELIEITKGARAAAHELKYNTRYDGKVIVLLYSKSNAAFADGEGELFNITVRATEECGNVKLTQIKGTDINANSYSLNFAGGENLSETTGLDGIDAAEDGARYFTIDGVEIMNPQPGQIVIKMVNGKAEKVVVK